MPQLPAELEWSGVHITAEELVGHGPPPTEKEVRETLARLSVYDCLRALGSLGVALVADRAGASREGQQKLIDQFTSVRPELHRRLSTALQRGLVIFFRQQLYHLGRLAVLYADDRKPDDFKDGELIGDFLVALFSVPDLFETDFESGDQHRAILSYELRQTAMNRSEARIHPWSLYFELFDKIWPTVRKAPDADSAFRRYTGVSISDYLAIGFAVSTGFGQSSDGMHIGRFSPAKWFDKAKVEEASWRAYLKTCAGPLAELRRAIEAEEEKAGRTTSLSLAIEKMPLIEDPDGLLYVTDFGAFERKATHGIFHILSEGAEDEGLDRETFTSPFGAAFQVWVEGCFQRTEGNKAEPMIFADVPYGSKKNRRDTSDVVLRYERQIVAVEVVAGAMQIKTSTHGDLDAFESDLKKLVLKKAGQLTRRITDIEEGDTAEIGLDMTLVGRVWPVIAMLAPFPHRAEAMRTARERIKKEDLLRAKTTGPPCIVSAEDVAALEAYLERHESDTALSVIVGWKHNRRSGDFSLTNFLWQRAGKLPPSAHQQQMFKLASEDMVARLFHDGPPQEQGHDDGAGAGLDEEDLAT
jgi:hypothetical protein